MTPITIIHSTYSRNLVCNKSHPVCLLQHREYLGFHIASHLPFTEFFYSHCGLFGEFQALKTMIVPHEYRALTFKTMTAQN